VSRHGTGGKAPERSTLARVVLLAGCVSVGKDFPVDQVPNIEIGVHSKANIEKLFGPPWRTGLEDGQLTWTYGDYKRSITGDEHNRDLVVRFNEDGVVSSYSFSSDKPEDTTVQKKPAAEF
jgi:hypothetical protein